jgi:uncharacterized membrane protein (DUF2068 family)
MGVSILAVLSGIEGVISLIIGIFIAVFSPVIVKLAEEKMSEIPANKEFMMAFFSVVSLIFIIVGLVSLLVAYGLWKGKKWAWFLFLAMLILGAIFSTLSLLAGVNVLRDLAAVAVTVLILYYVTRSHVREYFGVGRS